ncbi:hypothetical protein EBR96_02910 [bacterium]|nr:hypothetical protein [bacterium]
MSEHVHEFVNEPYSGRIWASIALLTVTLIATVYFGSVHYQSLASMAKDHREENGGVGQELAELHHFENVSLSATRWVNKEKGIVQIPINDAMDIVVKEYTGK